jgi:hypothetical protein
MMQESKELTREQLLTYVKKQKLRIKQLEKDLASASSGSADATATKSIAPAAEQSTVDDPNSEIVKGVNDLVSSFWSAASTAASSVLQGEGLDTMQPQHDEKISMELDQLKAELDSTKQELEKKGDLIILFFAILKVYKEYNQIS